MLTRLLVIFLLISLCGAWGFGMTVPSAGTTDAVDIAPVAGGSDLTDQQLILVVVGAVCATILLLALIS
ncbi:MAG: hypothetical protein ABIF71_01170 [Planctomycetota bacterium]